MTDLLNLGTPNFVLHSRGEGGESNCPLLPWGGGGGVPALAGLS